MRINSACECIFGRHRVRRDSRSSFVYRRGTRCTEMSFGCPDRHGISLIQMLVVITVLGATVSLSIRIFSAMFRSERMSVRQATRILNLGRLARQFRSDAHISSDCQLNLIQEPKRIEFELGPGRKVAYEATTHGLMRVVGDVDPLKAKAGNDALKQLFPLSVATIRFEKTQGKVPLVSMIIEEPAGALIKSSMNEVAGKLRVTRVDAALGSRMQTRTD